MVLRRRRATGRAVRLWHQRLLEARSTRARVFLRLAKGLGVLKQETLARVNVGEAFATTGGVQRSQFAQLPLPP